MTVAVVWLSLHAAPGRADELLANEPSRADLFVRLVKPPGTENLLPLSFSFPVDTRSDAIFGIDVSHYTQDGCKCQLNWAEVPTQKVGFVYLKATQGTAFIDGTFAPNWALLQSMPNLHRGAYHFLSGDADPTAQAQHFLGKLGKLQPEDMPPCLDLEWDFRTVNGQQRDVWSDLTADEILTRVQTWLDVVEKATGRRPLIYTSAAWWSGRIKDPTKFTKFQGYPIWIADYSAGGRGQEIPQVPDKQSWAIWQFTEVGSLSQGGVPGRLDVSIFKGTTAEFAQSFGLPLPQTATTPSSTTPTSTAATPPTTTTTSTSTTSTTTTTSGPTPTTTAPATTPPAPSTSTATTSPGAPAQPTPPPSPTATSATNAPTSTPTTPDAPAATTAPPASPPAPPADPSGTRTKP